MAIDLFDPTTKPEKAPIRYVPRPSSLQGLRAGLVDNTKYNSKTLLMKIADRLNARYGVQTALIVSKTSSGHPVPRAAIEEFKEKVDFVIAGVGD